MAILTPYGFVPGQYPSEIVGSIGANGRYLCPHDPQHNTTGEDGFYADSHLGGASGPQVIAQGPAPSDFQYASNLRYTPSVRGWVATQGGYVQGSLYPQPADGVYYPASPGALGDATSVAQAAATGATGYAPPTTTTDAARQEAYRKNVTFWLSVVTSAVIGGSALMAIYRGMRGLRHDRFIRDALEKKLL